MVQYTLQELVWAMGGSLHGVVEGSVREVCTDSRTVGQARGVLFFALVGPRHDGHDYVEELYRKGVRRFVISDIRPEYHDLPEATFLLVEDTTHALQRFATYHRQRFGIPVVGVAGSNGKTMVKEWLSEMLGGHLRVHHSPRSYNSQVGVPLAVLGLTPQYEVGVYEAGISAPGEMERLARIVQPTLGIFTNLGHAHQEGFASLEEKGREKMGLFRKARQLVVRADQTLSMQLAEALARSEGVALVRWSTSGREAEFQFSLHTAEAGGTDFEMRSELGTYTGKLAAEDGASIEDALHSLVAAVTLGLSPEEAIAAAGRLSAVPMRLERREGSNGHPIINDSYSCDLEALQVALEFLAQQAGSGKKALILSDILQHGIPADELYRRVSELMQRYGVERFVGIGQKLGEQREKFPGGEFYDSTEAFLKAFNRNSLKECAVLVKGSRSFGFERVCQLLEKRMHRTEMEISLTALEHNLNHYRGLLRPGVKQLVLVKAYAYGNGRDELAGLLAYHHVDYLGVAIADEGLALRRAGIELPIVVLNPAPDAFEAMVAAHLEPEIFSCRQLLEFNDTARRLGKERYPIHIKLDTGMHRVGFNPEEIPELLEALEAAESVRVSSIFTHLAAADDPSQDAFTLEQINLYTLLAEQIVHHIGYRVLRHVLNTAGIARFPQAQMDMVRLGIGLHGVSPVGELGLEPAASLKSFVAQVKWVKAGDTVGYGRRDRMETDREIATVPIGYADGYSRRLGNGIGKVCVGGQLAPTVGNICMDTLMIDVTGLGVQEGDEVVLFGKKPTVQEVAEWQETIAYEVLSGISARVARVYYSE